jgi:hypothetical protein
VLYQQRLTPELAEGLKAFSLEQVVTVLLLAIMAMHE